MTTPRRQVIRPLPKVIRDCLDDTRMEKLLARIDKEQASCTRWMSRLRRAFHQVEKAQRRLARFNHQVAASGGRALPGFVEVVSSRAASTRLEIQEAACP